MQIRQKAAKTIYAPMDIITVTGLKPGSVSVRDGQGREYYAGPVKDAVSFKVGGALGTHCVFNADAAGRIMGSLSFGVNCKTELNEDTGVYKELFDALHWTMVGWKEEFPESKTIRINGKIYNYFIHWLRDHTHTMKGMKWFAPELRTGIDLYADTQRADGMIYDLVNPRTPEPNWTEWANGKFGFCSVLDGRWVEMRRIPIENDVEWLFLEGLYFTWKACGDDEWMAGKLDAALKALKYSTSDPLRWSKKYGLLKRGYTIDTWDFQCHEDTKLVGQNMNIDPKKTRFGVMFGDNTGIAAGCGYLAEMLAHVGRKADASRVRKTGEGIRARLDKAAWNGRFFRHHVSEDPKIRRDLGVDESKQVSLSNAYSLNRGISHRQCVEIVKTYQDIRRRMPKDSPGEFFTIYPPFERGFGGESDKWQYMNAGVTSIVAGELAHGAFEHGFEEYGTDILKRTLGLARRHRNFLHCVFRGMMPETPKRSFTTLSLKDLANADTHGKGGRGVPGWTGEGANDLHELPVGKQRFQDIPFDITDPAKNGRKGVLGISAVKGYAEAASLAVNKKAASVYFLHTVSHGGSFIGTVTVRYADGSHTTDYINQEKIGTWWMPADHSQARVAWRGKNKTCPNVGIHLYGWNNPHPERIISSIRFEASRTRALWFIAGVTLCDKPVFFMPGDVSHGIPEPWGAAAVMYAMIEGAAGMKDTGVAFDKAVLAPRWSAAGVKTASATAKYEASGGYLSYEYRHDAAKKRMRVLFTGTAAETLVQILLPKGKQCTGMKLDGEEIEPVMRKVEKSIYACALVKTVGVHEVVVRTN